MNAMKKIIQNDQSRADQINDNPPPALEDCIKVLEAMGVDADFHPAGNYFRGPRHWRDWSLMSWELQINPMPTLRRNFPKLEGCNWLTVQYVFTSWQSSDLACAVRKIEFRHYPRH